MNPAQFAIKRVLSQKKVYKDLIVFSTWNYSYDYFFFFNREQLGFPEKSRARKYFKKFESISEYCQDLVSCLVSYN